MRFTWGLKYPDIHSKVTPWSHAVKHLWDLICRINGNSIGVPFNKNMEQPFEQRHPESIEICRPWVEPLIWHIGWPTWFTKLVWIQSLLPGEFQSGLCTNGLVVFCVCVVCGIRIYPHMLLLEFLTVLCPWQYSISVIGMWFLQTMYSQWFQTW